MKRRYNASSSYSFAVMLLLFALIVSACGGDNEPEPTQQPTEAPTSTPEPTTAPEPTEVPSGEPDEQESDNDSDDGAATETEASSNNGGLPDIYTFAVAQPEIAQFGALIERLDLVEKMQSEGPFTAFIPTNRALEALPSEIQEDDDLLLDLILYHIVADEILNQNLVNTPTATSLLGDDLRIYATDYGAMVENANLLGVTDQVSNGILYIIDKAVFPPELGEYLVQPSAVAGEETFSDQGNLHILQGERSPVEYNSTPPSSGPHYGNLVAWQIYEEPIRYEQVVHNLEDAGVLIYYQCDEGCPELLSELSEFAQPLIEDGRHVAVLPNDPAWTVGDDDTLHQDMDAPIALVAWQKVLKMDEFDSNKAALFVDAYEGIDHHARY